MDLLNLFVKIGVKDEASEAVENVSGNIIGKLGKAAAKAAKALAGMWAVKKVVDFGKAAFDAYSSFEQLAGGVAKLYGNAGLSIDDYAASVGKSVDEVTADYQRNAEAQALLMQNSREAWRTAGMDANTYMSSVTGFSSALINSLGGDTKKAAEIADMAMQDISDNANTFGKYTVEELTGVYQSLAKGQYQTLDNLNLGFGGTKEGLQQLIDKAEELSGVDYDASNFADIAQAIHVIQENAKITGTTQREAMGTIEGSMNATKAAWSNLVTEFGKPDADIGARIGDMFTALMGENGDGGLVRNVVGEVSTIASNIVNAIGNGISAGINFIATNGPQMVSDAMVSVGDALERAWDNVLDFSSGFDEWFDKALSSGKGAMNGAVGFVKNIATAISKNWPYVQDQIGLLVENLADFVQEHGPRIIETIGGILGDVGNAILEHGPELAGSLAETFYSLEEWITGNGPALVETVVGVLGTVIGAARDWIVANGPAILDAAKTAFGNIITAIVEHGPEILANVGETIGLVVGHIIDAAPKMLSAAAEFMGGLITGTSEEGEKLHQWFADFFPDGLLKGLGDFATFLLDAGKSLINGLLDGIGKVAPDVEEAIRGAFDKVLEFFGAIGDFLQDPVGSIQRGFEALMSSGEEAGDKNAENMDKINSDIQGAMGDSTEAIDELNKTGINDKSASVSVRGNVIEGKAKSTVDSTNRSVSSMRGKTISAKATGNATDGKAKSAIDNTKKAADNLSDKSITVSANGNVITGAAQSMVSTMKSWLGGLRDKTFTVTQKTVKTGGAWGGIEPNYHATGGIRVADRYGEGVPLDVVGERGPEAIVPLTSHYGKDFAQMMGAEAGKYLSGMMGGGNSYNLYYSGEQSALDIFDDLTFRMQVHEAMGD